MATMASPTIQSPQVSAIDILWAFYQSQTKKVQKAFRKRIAEEESAAKEAEAMKAYEQSLTKEQRQAAYEFADVVKSRVADVEKAASQGKTAGRKASEFLRELQAEEV